MIGINTDTDKAEYRKKAKSHKLNWRDAWQGSPSGALPTSWGINMYPSNFVLDGEGVIRYTNVHGERLDKVVSKLISEVEDEDA